MSVDRRFSQFLQGLWDEGFRAGAYQARLYDAKERARAKTAKRRRMTKKAKKTRRRR